MYQIALFFYLEVDRWVLLFCNNKTIGATIEWLVKIKKKKAMKKYGYHSIKDKDKTYSDGVYGLRTTTQG